LPEDAVFYCFDLSAWPKKEKKNPQGVDKTEKEIIISDRPVYHSNHNDCSLMAKARLSDIADLAGVSKAAAGKVLNGGTGKIRVGKEARQRILDAARKLDYHPNMAATILAGGSSKLIGVLIDSRAPDIHYGVLAEIEREADRRGYRILSAQAHDNPGKLLDSYYSLKQNGVDGIISFAHDYSHLDCHLDTRLRDDPKIVYVFNTSEEQLCSVDVDISSGMAAAVAHLRSGGYHKPVLILNLQTLSVSCRKRVESFARVCPEGKILTLNADDTDPADMEEQCSDLVGKLLIPGRFDSVITLNDYFAAAVMKCLLAEGIRIPDDMGLIGWDNLMFSEFLPVKLTSVCYDRKAVADTVLNTFLGRINGNTDPVRISIPMNLIPRESTKKQR
jgi:DNA-binding LacI/PurR family transcriptional regulator